MFRIVRLILLLVLLSNFAVAQQPSNHTFRIGKGDFLLDGKPFRIISGEMHFARIPRECWRDRLIMAKSMGLNTIATYIFWNYHEPVKGSYLFTGNADVAEFVRLAGEVGLWVIIRPSPYACAEWEFGGYPWWLQKEKGLKVRSRDVRFLEMSRSYFNALGRELAPLQVTRGGPVIMVQLENEYGSYDKDKEYLELNRGIIRDAGFDVELYTCDGPSQMADGYLPGIFPAVNGLDNVKEVKSLIDKYNGGHGPYFIAEWYPAWFDSWGLAHHLVPHQEVSGTYDTVLAAGYSINIYMMHGGTSREFWNGANMDRRTPYMPQTSSYDYDAPMDEAGNPTAKFMAFREVIAKNSPGTVIPPVPPPAPVISIPAIRLSSVALLFNNLPEPVVSEKPLTFEDLNQGYGYVLYRTRVKGPQNAMLKITNLRDYGIVYLNGKRVAVLDRRFAQESVPISITDGESVLDILVENLGRINYGPFLNDNLKGITSKVELGEKELTGWSIYPLPFETVPENLAGTMDSSNGPVVLRGTFDLKVRGDCYLDMRQFGKGVAWINGRNLGRYWSIGPQQTLYIPAAWLKTGSNEVVIFEQLNTHLREVAALDHPILDQLNNPRVFRKSLSTGCKTKLSFPFSPRYGGGGEGAVTDGIKGSVNFRDGFWQGYEGTDMIAVVDLGSIRKIGEISTGALRNQGAWIFLPAEVVYETSSDGEKWESLAVVRKGGNDGEEAIREEYIWKAGEQNDTRARYIRVTATGVKVCPENHPGKGKKAWLFIDEIYVD